MELTKAKQGRSALAHSQKPMNIRPDTDVMGAVNEPGAGWQTRLNTCGASNTQTTKKQRQIKQRSMPARSGRLLTATTP